MFTLAIGVAVYVANRNQQVILSRPSRSIETGWLLHFCSINKDAKPGINAIGTKLCIFNRIPTFASWTSSVRSSLPALDVGSSLLRPFKSRSSSGLNSQGESVRFRCVLQDLFAHLPFSSSRRHSVYE